MLMKKKIHKNNKNNLVKIQELLVVLKDWQNKLRKKLLIKLIMFMTNINKNQVNYLPQLHLKIKQLTKSKTMIIYHNIIVVDTGFKNLTTNSKMMMYKAKLLICNYLKITTHKKMNWLFIIIKFPQKLNKIQKKMNENEKLL